MYVCEYAHVYYVYVCMKDRDEIKQSKNSLCDSYKSFLSFKLLLWGNNFSFSLLLSILKYVICKCMLLRFSLPFSQEVEKISEVTDITFHVSLLCYFFKFQ